MRARVIGFGYVASLLLIALIQPSTETQPAPAVGTASSLSSVATPETDALSDLSSDLQRALDQISAGTVGVADLQRRNPSAYASMAASWQAEKARGGSLAAFTRHAFSIADGVLATALRGPDTKLITDHARSYVNQLRWAAQGSMTACTEFLAGTAKDPPPRSFILYRGKLLGRALLGGPVDVQPPPPEFRISKAIVTAARPRSGLSPADFGRARHASGNLQRQHRTHRRGVIETGFGPYRSSEKPVRASGRLTRPDMIVVISTYPGWVYWPSP